MDKNTVESLLRDLKIDLRDASDYALTNDRVAIRSQIGIMEVKLQKLWEATELDMLEELEPIDFEPILAPVSEPCFLGAQSKESTMTKNEKLKAEILAEGERKRKANRYQEVVDYSVEDRKRLRTNPLDAGSSNPLYGQ